MKRNIRKVAVLGSGTMGAQIACHFANIGLEVYLLDIIPKELTHKEEKSGITKNDKAFRNRIVDENLKKTLDTNPSPVYKKDYAKRISTGNFEDDLHLLGDCDWILEAIIEDLDIKKDLFSKVEQHRKEGTLVTTNTSGISINKMTEGRSEDFKGNFCGTHFFNPPRYLPLLELIPSRETSRETLDFLGTFGERNLGKTTIACKDTPAFIANRIGIYAIMLSLKLMRKSGMTVEEIDSLTGKSAGRPKSATFRTCDLVGIDVLGHVANDLYENLTDDEEREIFKLPHFLEKMIENQWYGNKTGQGFYKKVKDKQGESTIYALNLDTLEYREQDKPKFLIIEDLKDKTFPEEKIKTIRDGETEGVGLFKKLYLGTFGNSNNKAVAFYHSFFYQFFTYCSNRIPEIADEIYKVDEAIKKGFGWELGPFETWDIFGVEETLKKLREENLTPAKWVQEMVDKGYKSFYKIEKGVKYYYDHKTRSYKEVPGSRETPAINILRKEALIWHNESTNLIDLGDGVLNVQFTSRNNTIDDKVMDGLEKAIEYGRAEFEGITIANEGDDFSFGADLGTIGWAAYKGNYKEIEKAVDKFQRVNIGLRDCEVPVVAAPHGRTLGGGVELCMHADAVVPASETYMGLVEMGVGLIPGGAGTKEFTRRAAENYSAEDPKVHHLQQRVMTISQATVATSVPQAYDYGFLIPGRDNVVMNKDHLVKEAKKKVLELSNKGYIPAGPPKIKVLGRSALSFFYMGISNMKKGNFITEYEEYMSRKLAYVMCGGDLSGEQEVDESYILQLEKEVFLELIKNKKTLERMNSMLRKGKPLRN